MPQKHFDIKIIGQVQGIGFRYGSAQKAQELKIAGFVRNEPDGSVYIEVEGEEEILEKFKQWCQSGPRWAKVERVEVKEGKIKKFGEFNIQC